MRSKITDRRIMPQSVSDLSSRRYCNGITRLIIIIRRTWTIKFLFGLFEYSSIIKTISQHLSTFFSNYRHHIIYYCHHGTLITVSADVSL